jgi:hypothetical protein
MHGTIVTALKKKKKVKPHAMQEHHLFHLQLQQQHVPSLSMLAQAKACHSEKTSPSPKRF